MRSRVANKQFEAASKQQVNDAERTSAVLRVRQCARAAAAAAVPAPALRPLLQRPGTDVQGEGGDQKVQGAGEDSLGSKRAFFGGYLHGCMEVLQPGMVYDYKIRPWEAAHGLKDKHAQQLRVVMTQCVDCVSGCPAYKLHPFRADNFDQFQKMAMKQCGNCFEGVKGPCPANKDNHGVL